MLILRILEFADLWLDVCYIIGKDGEVIGVCYGVTRS